MKIWLYFTDGNVQPFNIESIDYIQSEGYNLMRVNFKDGSNKMAERIAFTTPSWIQTTTRSLPSH